MKKVDFYVITEAKVIKVPSEALSYTLRRYKEPKYPIKTLGTEEQDSVLITEENLRGREFVSNGKRIRIAWDSGLQEFLGIPIEAWHNSNKLLTEVTEELWEKNAKLNIICNAKWYTRLLWLFTGVKIK